MSSTLRPMSALFLYLPSRCTHLPNSSELSQAPFNNRPVHCSIVPAFSSRRPGILCIFVGKMLWMVDAVGTISFVQYECKFKSFANSGGLFRRIFSATMQWGGRWILSLNGLLLLVVNWQRQTERKVNGQTQQSAQSTNKLTNFLHYKWPGWIQRQVVIAML